MFVKIYGRMTCPYCVRARNLAEKLSNEVDGFSYEFIDMIELGLSKDDIAKAIGLSEVQTVPQVVIDGQPIGGSTDFLAFAKEKFGITL
ncbi:glutaredoxin [Pasteurellaceae bacterium Pebbles2]|nr:glutaredoxin [Pasteurellaceae bacterium Pebbles2]